MDDQYRHPRDGDRAPVRHRIERAVADGRISAADGQIRLTNVTSAQSMSELGLIVRDLDQLEAVIQPGATVDAPPPITALPGVTTGVRRTVPFLIVGLAVAVLAAGAVGLFAFSSGERSSVGSPNGGLLEPLPPGPTTSVEEPGAEPGGEPAAKPGKPAAPYRLDAAGIKRFLADYRQRFSTTKVVNLALYDEYVIVRVPIAGKQRNTGWRYADGRFDDFGPPMANFPGSAILDTTKLDLAKLLRNVATARRTLKVEDYNLTYVSLDYRPDFDDEPNVNIYVTNAFSESGYLATTLDGRIERSYPFGG